MLGQKKVDRLEEFGRSAGGKLAVLYEMHCGLGVAVCCLSSRARLKEGWRDHLFSRFLYLLCCTSMFPLVVVGIGLDDLRQSFSCLKPPNTSRRRVFGSLLPQCFYVNLTFAIISQARG